MTERRLPPAFEARVIEFVMNAPTCEPNADNHYGWPKENVRWRCFNCDEWCYAEGSPCFGCEARILRVALGWMEP